MVDSFCSLVRITSLSGHEATVAEALARQLTELGLSVEFDKAHEPIGGEVGNLIAKLPATDPYLPTLMLQSHMDTVTPGHGISPQVGEEFITSAGDTILGADAKAGINVILHAVREVVSLDIAHGELQVVLCIAEETGLFGARYLDYSAVSPAYCFVFDGGRQAGGMVIGAPSAYKLTWEVRGKAAHAGVHPEQGINAVQAAAAGIARMRLGRIDFETTSNVGIISGGQARNIVPDCCMVEAEARSHDHDKLESQLAHMTMCMAHAAEEYGAEFVEVERVLSYKRFRLEEEAPIVRIASSAAEAIGIEPSTEIGGGGSDANIFNDRGLPAVICATGAESPHTLTERLNIAEHVRCAEWLVEIVREAR
jgi:tripeptide aminopeptidase